MAFEKKFELKMYILENAEVSGHMPDAWANHLGEAGALIKDKIDERIPDEVAFISKMVKPSEDGFRPFVDPTFVSRKERTSDNIRSARRENMTKSFARWKENLGKVFATVDGVVAKLFKEKVQAAKDRWALKIGAGTLRMTGDKIRGRGPAPVATYYLVGDNRAKDWVGPSGTSDGEPYNIARNGERNALKTAIQQRIIQGGLMVIKSEMDPAQITAQNIINASLLNGLRDPAKCDIFVATAGADKCFCLWEVDTEGRLNLHVQVGITV
ncbi:MAG: hypothetical protein WC980_10365 [Candidatus Brocadiia bacterium]